MLTYLRSRRGAFLRLRIWLASSIGILTMATACGAMNQIPAASTWRAVDLPGIASGFRGAVYDPARDSIWIMSRTFDQDDAPTISLTEVHAASGAATETTLKLPGDGFIDGLISVDNKSHLWLGWGSTLATYDPTTGSSETWKLPPETLPTGQTAIPGLDGNMVAMAIDSVGEIWVATYGVGTIFGFNATSKTWDRTIDVSIDPFLGSRLASSQAGQLLLNGWDIVVTPRRPTLEVIDTVKGVPNQLGIYAIDYAMSDSGHAVYVDDSGNLGEVALVDASITAKWGTAPMAHEPHLTVDKSGRIWFSMLGWHEVGLGELDGTSGVFQTYPLPQPEGGPSGGLPICPPQNAPYCANSSSAFDPDVQSIALDARGDVWVITRVNGSGDPTSFTTMSPVYELALGE